MRDFGLKERQLVELTPKKPKIEIETTSSGGRTINGIPIYALEELLADMDRLGPESEPESVDWGPDRGSERIDNEYSRGEITLEDILNGSAPKRG